LLRKLGGGEAGALDAVLNRLEAQGLLSEARFGEQYVRQRSAKGYGPLRIRAELQQRGLDEAQLDQCLRDAEIDWEALLQQVIARKFPGPLPADRREQARIQRALYQRGFSDELIRRALKGLDEA